MHRKSEPQQESGEVGGVSATGRYWDATGLDNGEAAGASGGQCGEETRQWHNNSTHLQGRGRVLAGKQQHGRRLLKQRETEEKKPCGGAQIQEFHIN